MGSHFDSLYRMAADLDRRALGQAMMMRGAGSCGYWKPVSTGKLIGIARRLLKLDDEFLAGLKAAMRGDSRVAALDSVVEEFALTPVQFEMFLNAHQYLMEKQE
jgi:hypothetical protein